MENTVTHSMLRAGVRARFLLALFAIAGDGLSLPVVAVGAPGVEPAVKSAPVPACFTAPPAADVAPGARTADPAWAAAPCRLLAALLDATPTWDVQWITGDGLNHNLGLTQGGFASDTYALQFRVSAAFNARFHGIDELVRFSTDDGRTRGGSWWTPLEMVQDAAGRTNDAQHVVAVLALPGAPPTMMAHSVAVAPGTVGYFGLVAPGFGQPGGAVQFWFPAEPVWSTSVDTLPASR